MKCDKCSKKLEKTFLDKPLGTAVKEQGKTKWLCSDCQRATA